MTLPSRTRLSAGLLILFAFCAWNLTGLANAALGILILLFLLDLPSHWTQLRRDPAFLLLLVALGVTSLLAWRAAVQFPETAPQQWDAVLAWTFPFLFVVVAWSIKGDERLMRSVLAAAAIGLVVGVLRKSDWSLLDAMLAGERYHFGYAALGLGFLVSVMLVGVVLFRRRILGLRLMGAPRPMIGAILWVLGLAFTIAVLVITQSRGSVLSLGLVAAGYGLVLVLRPNRGEGHTGPRPALVIASALLLLALMSLVLWSSRERIYFDFESLVPAAGEVASTHEGLGYVSSTAIRINLYDLGLRLFAARPLLGWGPGTSATEYLVRKRVIPLSERHLTYAPQASHLHSVPIEILVRFGLAGLALGFLTLSLIIGAYRRMWSWSADPALKLFLVAGGLLALLFVLFDFRLIHLDFRFFFIVFFGILYSYRFAGSGPAGQSRGGALR